MGVEEGVGGQGGGRVGAGVEEGGGGRGVGGRGQGHGFGDKNLLINKYFYNLIGLFLI